MRRISAVLLASSILFVGPQFVSAQRRTSAETTLVGIRLFDSVYRLLDVYGNPDEIQAVGGGGGGFTPVAAASSAPQLGGRGQVDFNPTGAGTGGGAPVRGGGRRDTGGVVSPFGFGDENLRQGARGEGGRGGGGRGGGGGQGPSLGTPAGTVSAAAPAEQANFTRWVYKRGGGKYGFVLDGRSRVIQIEAIGLENNKVKTRRGIGFGATFTKVLKVYGLPDSYDVGGNSITMRYLSKDKVIFRLNRLGLDKPHVVTGVLVAAGKS